MFIIVILSVAIAIFSTGLAVCQLDSTQRNIDVANRWRCEASRYKSLYESSQRELRRTLNNETKREDADWWKK